MLNATLIRADELLPTDTIFIGNFQYPIARLDQGGDVVTVTLDETTVCVILTDTQVWILDRPDPDISDEDTYEEMREAANTAHVMGTCPITQVTDCRSRQCELHYMDAPILLGPGECPACLGPRDHLPLTGTCTDVLAGMGAIQ